MYLTKILLFIFLIILIFVPSFFFLLELRRVSVGGISPYNGKHKADCAVVLIRHTGNQGPEGFDFSLSHAVRKWVILAVPSELSLRDILPQKTKDIILEEQSKSLYEDAERALRLVKQHSCKNILLIASSLHIYRAQRLFRTIFPPGYRINMVAAASSSISFESYVVEALKSLFYSLWAY